MGKGDIDVMRKIKIDEVELAISSLEECQPFYDPKTKTHLQEFNFMKRI